MSVQQLSVVCKDISSQQKFVFMNQSINFQDNNYEIINVTKSVQVNPILSTFLNNSILFVKTKTGDLNIGCYPHSFSIQEVFVQSSQIEGYEIQSVEIIYQRLSSSEVEELQPQSISSQSSQQSNKNNNKRNQKKPFRDLCVIDDESMSGSSTQYNNNNNNKKIKTECLNSNKFFQEDFLNQFEEEQDLHLEKRKISHTSQTSSVTQLVQQNLNNNYPSFMSTSDSLSKNDDLFEQNQNTNLQNSSFNNNLSRSKERTVASAIRIVSQWRDLYEKYKEERIFRDLQEIAEEIGLSKKVLDYYFLELRTAEFFGFDFDQNLEQKFGKIRKFNNSHKQAYIIQNNNKKIPINGNFNYRMNQYKQSRTNSTNCVSKPFKITTINNPQWSNKYHSHSQNANQNTTQYKAPSNNYIYNMQAIHL